MAANPLKNEGKPSEMKAGRKVKELTSKFKLSHLGMSIIFYNKGKYLKKGENAKSIHRWWHENALAESNEMETCVALWMPGQKMPMPLKFKV